MTSPFIVTAEEDIVGKMIKKEIYGTIDSGNEPNISEPAGTSSMCRPWDIGQTSASSI